MNRNIKLVIEYDGTRYCGWQRQENGPTIQNELEKALRQLLQHDVTLHGAGRTDAGVHARGQVANFVTSSSMGLEVLVRGINALLVDDIVIHDVQTVPEDFHARYSAKERVYSYTISRNPSALMRNYIWQSAYALDIDCMNNAARLITGDHDFSSFCKSEADVEHYRCLVHAASWKQEGSLLIFTIRANRFLHGMVRALVGTMVDAGRGFTSFDEFKKIFEGKDRNLAGMSAPAKGLMLEEVRY